MDPASEEPVDILALYTRATREAFRLETRQMYAVPAESAQFRAFMEGRPLPPDPHVNRSMQVISTAASAGVRVHRVHVADLPLTAYLRYELIAYGENITAGEDIRIAVRSWHPGLARLTEDFVLFDSQAMVWMLYDGQGHLTARDYSDSTSDLATAVRQRDLALAYSISLSEFGNLIQTWGDAGAR
jgi:hypothetical protein